MGKITEKQKKEKRNSEIGRKTLKNPQHTRNYNREMHVGTNVNKGVNFL